MNTLIETARAVWPHPNEPIDMGVEDGIVWAICKSPGVGVNGYALIPAEGHPWSAGIPRVDDNGYECSAADLLDVHGGITYNDGKWIGFDTGHAFDVWEPEFDEFGITHLCGDDQLYLAAIWTVDQVIEEAKDLARQVAAVGEKL